MKTIEELIQSGIDLIRKQQLPDGSFSNTNGYKTTFLTSNILSCLELCDYSPDVDIIRSRGLNFLKNQRSKDWSFNYWARGSEEATAMPYPDDLDDTFAALNGIHSCDANIINGTALAKISQLLTTLEVVPGGPYRTWLVDSMDSRASEWLDVDIVVNANIAYFLSCFGVHLSPLETFINNRIHSDDLKSPYYPGLIQCIYFVSRLYRGLEQELEKRKLAGLINRERSDGELWRNSLESAMAISALIDSDFSQATLRDVVEKFIERLSFDGWQPYPFCIDPSRGKDTQYSAASSISAAFCIEALLRFKNIDEGNNILDTGIKENYLSNIKTIAKSKYETLPVCLKEQVAIALDAMATEEVCMIPYMTSSALQSQNCPDFLASLALANLYGWIAYDMYDDILDGDGSLYLLSVANFFLRELTNQYKKLDEKIPGLYNYFESILNAIDNANMREQFHPQSENFIAEELADRSMGHALPAIAVLLAHGYDPGCEATINILNFFHYYLAARQLHDDAHDWKEDFASGRKTGVVSRLSNLAKNQKEIPLENIFWRDVIPEIIEKIQFFLDESRRNLMKVQFSNQAAFEILIIRLENAAEITAKGRANAIGFLDTYRLR